MVTPILSPSTSRRNSSINSSNKPTWLLSTLSDLEERMKILAMNPINEDQQQHGQGDTFAERAESYYQKRPQLLALLHDLYNSYVTLSDRYMQSNSKITPTHKRQLSLSSAITNDIDTDMESDADSSLSYQQQDQEQASLAEGRGKYTSSDYDALVAELVARNVEVEAATEEASEWERRFGESARKAELQRSLLEVLESERVVLLNENARLEYRAVALAEENEGLAAEALFMRRRAGELARRAVARMREEQRVCMLTRKIVDLQHQIYGLEKRNKEYYESNNTTTSSCCSTSTSSVTASNSATFKSKKNRNEVALEGCFKMTRKIKLNQKISKVIRKRKGDGDGEKKKNIGFVIGLWERVKSLDLFVCGVKSEFN